MSERGPDQWLEEILKCQYLPEPDMKHLCEIVKGLLMEGMFALIVNTRPGTPRSTAIMSSFRSVKEQQLTR